jgi:hypothetical protein
MHRLPQDRPQGSPIKLLVIRNDNLGKRLGATQDDVTSFLV